MLLEPRSRSRLLDGQVAIVTGGSRRIGGPEAARADMTATNMFDVKVYPDGA